MPMIPEEELERIKRSVDLAAVIRSRGVDLKPSGHDLLGLCPFHADKNPSLHVTPGKGLWRCVSCGATGNVIQFVQNFDGVSFRHAFELLNGGAAFTGAPAGAPVKKATVPKLPAPVTSDADDQAALRKVLDYYHERLPLNPSALAYLDKRGISPEAAKTFRIGFVDRTLGLRLPNNQRKEGAVIRERLTKLGILRESGHEHLRGRIVFPIIAENGEIGTVYGRAIDDDGGKHGRHLFLPGPQRGIFNPAALRSPEVIVTEGVIDALSFWCAGLQHVTTGYSAKALPEELLDALLAARVQRVFIAFDRDEAGDRGAQEVAAQLMARGVECRRVLFPHGLDANDYARQVQPASKSLGMLLNAAQWIGNGQNSGRAGGKGSALATPARVKNPGPTDAAASGLRGVDAAASFDALRVPASSLAASSDSVGTKAAADATGEKAIDVPATAVRHEMPEASPGAGSLTLQLQGEHWFLELDGRQWRVGGLEKTLGTDALKVALRLKVVCGRGGSDAAPPGAEAPAGAGSATLRFHLDSLDLAKDGERRRFIERAAEETGLHADLLKRDMGRLLLALEQAQAGLLSEASAKAQGGAPLVVLTAQERAEALAWLRGPDLIGRLRAALGVAGIVGEERNALVAYLAAVSRKLERPLAVIVQSASAAGKTTLMDAVLSFFPEEERVKYSAMTGQSLYYLGETNLKHKILAIVEEAGAEKASYALKLLQSEGELTIASTGKDPATGRMETQEYRVEGPVMIMLTTTAIDLDEELQNRCLTLAVDESPEQTAAIHRLQRERRTLAGLQARAGRSELLRVLKNAQRLLAPVEVLNPFAPELTFPSARTRNRRDHEKYLTLIDAIALLHQHQRPRGRHEVAAAAGGTGRAIEYVEVSLDDIALANELAPEVLGRSLDELPPQTRALLGHVRALVRNRCEGSAPAAPGRTVGPAPAHDARTTSARHAVTFSRRELHQLCGWSFTQLRVHLERLVEHEYLGVCSGRMGSQFLYELLIDAEAPADATHVPLLDVERLRGRHAYDSNLAGQTGHLAGVNGHLAGGDGAGARGVKCA